MTLAGRAGIEPPAISLPTGGGAIRGIGEKFTANPVTVTGPLRVPLATSSPEFTLNALPRPVTVATGQAPAWTPELPAAARALPDAVLKVWWRLVSQQDRP